MTRRHKNGPTLTLQDLRPAPGLGAELKAKGEFAYVGLLTPDAFARVHPRAQDYARIQGTPTGYEAYLYEVRHWLKAAIGAGVIPMVLPLSPEFLAGAYRDDPLTDIRDPRLWSELAEECAFTDTLAHVRGADGEFPVLGSYIGIARGRAALRSLLSSQGWPRAVTWSVLHAAADSWWEAHAVPLAEGQLRLSGSVRVTVRSTVQSLAFRSEAHSTLSGVSMRGEVDLHQRRLLLMLALAGQGGVVLRSCTGPFDLGLRESVRMWVVTSGVSQALPASHAFAAGTTVAETGEMMPPEAHVEYLAAPGATDQARGPAVEILPALSGRVSPMGWVEDLDDEGEDDDEPEPWR